MNRVSKERTHSASQGRELARSFGRAGSRLILHPRQATEYFRINLFVGARKSATRMPATSTPAAEPAPQKRKNAWAQEAVRNRHSSRYYCNATMTCLEHNENRWRPSKFTIGILFRPPILYRCCGATKMRLPAAKWRRLRARCRIRSLQGP